MNNSTENLYKTDEYIEKNPSLHEEDSPWKVSKIIPLIDKLSSEFNKDEINLLDVGGGAGIIINSVVSHINESYNKKVNKYLLDLSPGMLDVQKKTNPDFVKALNENISKTSLENKEIDLTLMIDVLEHLPNPGEALQEVKRISKYVILKVPLENNLFLNASNFITKGKTRKHAAETIGHINVYKFSGLKKQIEKHLGKVLHSNYTNVFDYYLSSKYYLNIMGIKDGFSSMVARQVFRISPKLCSLLFSDFVMVLVKCY